MDKKTEIIVCVLIVAVLALIVGAFIVDFKDDTIITINDVKYSTSDFDRYYKLRYFEELNSNKNTSESSEEETSNSEEVDKEQLKSTTLNEFATYMIISDEAKAKGYKLPEETVKSIEAEYDAEDFDRETLNNIKLSKEDYIEARKLVETYNGFLASVDEYYETPQSTIDNYFELNKDTLKGIDFRIMQFNITSTEATTNEDGEEVPATTNKEEVTAKAQEILDRVKAGEDFETLAKDNANQRIIVTPNEIKPVNGELESCDLPYLSAESYFALGGSEIIEPLKALKNPGDYTDLVTSDSYVMFAKLEATRDNIQDSTREAMIKGLKQSVGQSYLASLVQSSQVIVNNPQLKTIEI